MISRPIFAIFSPNESVLGADDRSGPLFSISQGTLPWQPILWQNYLPPCTYRSGIQKRNGITPCICWLNSTTNATISCKILVKIGPVVSAENILIEIELRVHVAVRHISSNISICTGLIFAIFSPYESALHDDDRSVPYYPIYQGRCHGNQIMLP